MDSSGINGEADDAAGKVKSHTSLHISTSQRGLITCGKSPHHTTALSDKLKLLKITNLSSPSAKFQHIAEAKDEVSRAVPSSTSLHIRERFHRIFSKQINWSSLWGISKEWLKNPLNLALFFWILCIAASGAILFMVMTGMLNRSLPKKSQRDAWFEVNNQILNALFTLMCLYQHPKRIHHLALLLRWRPDDVSRLRKIYCKNGTYKPHEWAHMMVVVILLNVNCLAQYALCGLNLGYRRSVRPPIGVGICLSIAIGAPAAAGLYSMLSPLGKDYEHDQEAQMGSTGGSRRVSLEKRFSFAPRENEGPRPGWSGGVLDFWDDISTAYLSLFCGVCVFGWNMERLGFGNMYVHMATFLLLCFAPFWIFNLAAVNIDNETVREALGVTGIVLCVFGLLYGGFWRVRMRERFNLPSHASCCCGRPAVADFCLWLFCCWCALAQEVRTGNEYDVVEDKFYKKRENSERRSMLPLPREEGMLPSRWESSSPFERSPARFSNVAMSNVATGSQAKQLSLLVEEGSSARAKDETMVPPGTSVISRDGR